MRLFVFLALLIPILTPLVLGHPKNPADILSIQHTLAQVMIAFDSKNFDSLSDVFTSDAFQDYSPASAGTVLRGLPEIQKTLGQRLSIFTTQHSLTTQLINVLSHDKAESVAYFISTHWGINGSMFEGKVITGHARFEDKLRVEDGVWKIYKRHFVLMGPTQIENVTELRM